ncbi:MAG: hypothetical protein NTX01_03890, partial [Candidatus Omnitrophica bacterium]|nr:hypothetical protein [Candidatus Omnitrophota bacterium]
PWQLIQEKKPDLDKRLLMIPPVDLDAMLVKYANSLAQGGNNVLTDPSLFYFSTPIDAKIKKI